MSYLDGDAVLSSSASRHTKLARFMMSYGNWHVCFRFLNYPVSTAKLERNATCTQQSHPGLRKDNQEVEFQGVAAY